MPVSNQSIRQRHCTNLWSDRSFPVLKQKVVSEKKIRRRSPQWVAPANSIGVNTLGSPLLPMSVISTDDERSGATEEAWKDPEDACATTQIQGVRPRDWPRNRGSNFRPAGENVDPKLVLEFVAHPAKDRKERTPRIGVAEDASSGSLHSPSVPFESSGSLRVGRDDRH